MPPDLVVKIQQAGRLVVVAADPDIAGKEARAAGSRWLLAGSAVAGCLLGVLGRDVPLVVALRFVAGTSEARPCGMEEAAECAIEHLPATLGALLLVGLAMIVVSSLLALGGTALVLVGLIRHRRGGRGWAAPVSVAGGTALTVPALWLFVGFIRALAA